jgi:hypothetical protein
VSIRQRFAALDTGFLLSLALGDTHCEEVVDWLQKVKFFGLATPTALQELADIERISSDEKSRQAAYVAMSSITKWMFIEPELSDVHRGIAPILADKLLEKNILGKSPKNDALALVEAGLMDCKMFITYRKSLLAAEYDSLRLALLECQVEDLLVVSPEHIVSYIQKQTKSKS